MVKEEKRAPRLRLNGYTDDWEQVKLEDIADVTKLAGFEFTKYVEYSDTGSIIALRGLNVKNGKLILDDVKYIDNSDFKKLKRSKLYKNDILFTYVGTVGELAIIKENDRFYLAPNVSRIRIKDDTDSKFIIQSMNRKDFYNHIIFPLIATSSQPALSMGNIRKFKLNIPSIIFEQHKIGILLSHIDNNINLHERKYEKLNLIKKALLQKLFPKKDEVIPEVRYKNFSDAWEQRKLGEVVKIQSGFTGDSQLNNGKFKISRIETISNGVIDSKKIGFSNTTPNKKYKLKVGDILYSNINSIEHIGKIAKYIEDIDLYHGINLLRLSSVNENSSFLFYELNTENKRNWAKSHANKAVNQASINQTELKKQRLDIPSIEEQNLISNFLIQLDSLITLHQHKLKKLKQLKKFLLQNMFI